MSRAAYDTWQKKRKGEKMEKNWKRIGEEKKKQIEMLKKRKRELERKDVEDISVEDGSDDRDY
jgi:hypothetical protein